MLVPKCNITLSVVICASNKDCLNDHFDDASPWFVTVNGIGFQQLFNDTGTLRISLDYSRRNPAGILFYTPAHMNFPSAQACLLTPSSTAAMPQSSPWQCVPSSNPALALPCSSVSTVSNPKITGTPRSNCTFMRPWDVASAMYSKCKVSPLISTPIAMMAEKGVFKGSFAIGTLGVLDF